MNSPWSDIEAMHTTNNSEPQKYNWGENGGNGLGIGSLVVQFPVELSKVVPLIMHLIKGISVEFSEGSPIFT